MKYQLKKKTEIQNTNGEYIKLSTSMTWLYPYCKETEERIKIIESLISYDIINQELLKIKSCVK